MLSKPKKVLQSRLLDTVVVIFRDEPAALSLLLVLNLHAYHCLNGFSVD